MNKQIRHLLAELRYQQITLSVDKNMLRRATEKVLALIKQIKAQRAKTKTPLL